MMGRSRELFLYGQRGRMVMKAQPLSPAQIAEMTGSQTGSQEMLKGVSVAAPKQQIRQVLSLSTHCGSQFTSLENLQRISTPPCTKSHITIPHIEVFRMVHGALEGHRLTIVQHVHAVSQDGAKYFSMMEVRNGGKDRDFSTVIGCGNSHDKTIAARVVCGSGVFVCDNLSFLGGVSIARKHTRNVMRDFPSLVDSAVDKIMEVRETQDIRMQRYRECRLDTGDVYDLAIDACDRGVLNPAKIYQVIQEYRQPSYEEFAAEGNVWRILNAFTHVLKPRKDSDTSQDLFTLPGKTQVLHEMLDRFVEEGTES